MSEKRHQHRSMKRERSSSRESKRRRASRSPSARFSRDRGFNRERDIRGISKHEHSYDRDAYSGHYPSTSKSHHRAIKEYSSSDEDKKKSGPEHRFRKDDTFSFLDYKYEVNKVLQYCDLSENQDDFWKFLRKYEAVKKKIKASSKPLSNSNQSE